MASQKMKSEFYMALNAVATERGISVDEVLESIKAAVLAAYAKDFNLLETDEYSVNLDSQTGEMRLMKGGADVTPPGFGRIAATTARQVIIQKIREAEKGHIVSHYQDMIGSLVRGRIVRADGRFWTVDLGKSNAIMPQEEQVERDALKLNDSGQFYLKEIREDNHGNPQIIVSRAHPKLVEELFKREVPEINSGAVRIVNIVRSGGIRTKMAVVSEQTGVDPVGASVGQKGIRVKSVNDELGGDEKIDIIQFHADPQIFIKDAIAPAECQKVEIDKKEKRASVYVVSSQASVAIGRAGTNVRLASELTGYDIDIIEIPDTTSPPVEKATTKQDSKGEKPTEKTEENAKEELGDVHEDTTDNTSPLSESPEEITPEEIAPDSTSDTLVDEAKPESSDEESTS